MKKVLAGGSFVLPHQGHIFFLERARELGDYLVVVIASDETLRKKKKPLLLSAEKRKKLIERLGIADKVIIGSSSDFLEPVRKERPDIIVLGYDQRFSKELLKRIKEELPNCKIVRMHSKLKGYSTTSILKKLGIKKQNG